MPQSSLVAKGLGVARFEVIQYAPSMLPMTPEQFRTLHEILKASVDSVNGFWSLYSVVVFALLGYVFAAAGPVRSRAVRLVLASVFAVFAFSNGHALIREHKKLFAISQYVVGELRKHPEMESLATSFERNKPSEPSYIVGFHIFLDLIVVMLVLAAPTIKRAKPNAADG